MVPLQVGCAGGRPCCLFERLLLLFFCSSVLQCVQAVTITKLPIPGISDPPLVVKGTATFLTSAEAARMRRGGLPPPQPSDTVRTTYRAEGNPSKHSHWREPGFYSAPSDFDDRNYSFNSNEVIDRTYNEDRDYYPMYYTPPEEKRCKDRDCPPRRPIRFGYDASAPSRPGPSRIPEDLWDGRRPDWGQRRNPFITSHRFRDDGSRRDPEYDRRDPEYDRRDVWSRQPGGDRSYGSFESQREDPGRGNQYQPGRYGGTSTGWHNGRGIAHIDRFQGSGSSSRNYEVRGPSSGPDRYPDGPRGRSVPDSRRARWSRDCAGARDDPECAGYEAIVGFYGRWRRES